MELEKEKIDLIERIIKSDKKYSNNEDLFEDFLNETYKRSFLVMKTVKNEASVEAYLRKIATTSIITVLKNSGRIRRSPDGFVSLQEEPLEQTVTPSENKYANINIGYDIIDLNDGPEEIVIRKETLQKLSDAVMLAHTENPAKQYMQLYQMRYVKGLKQKQIAQELNLSQGEVSKRLLELLEKVKAVFNEA